MDSPTLAIEGGAPAVTSPIGDRWENITERERTLVNSALEAGSAVYDQIEYFEAEFRHFVGTRYALAVCNGTAALHSAMFAAGAARGREVIVPSVTWHASYLAGAALRRVARVRRRRPGDVLYRPGRRAPQSHRPHLRHRRHPRLRQPGRP